MIMSIPSRNVAFTKPDEPAFLKKFKAKVGYKEPATIEDKKQRLTERAEADKDDEVEREDEQPTVVVLKSGDIGPEEFEAYRLQMKEKQGKSGETSVPTVEPRPSHDDGDSSEGGKIVFKKPTKKRKSSDGGGGVLDATTSKKPRQGEAEEKGGAGRRRRRSSGGESKSKGVKNKSLLSFGDNEEED